MTTRRDTIIRPAIESDLDAVLRIERESFAAPWSREGLRRELGGKHVETWFRVAERKGEVAGYLLAYFVVDEVQLAKMAVAPRVRRRGVGHVLLESLVAGAREREMALVTLEVRVTNQAALLLYNAHGFVETGIRPGYYQSPAGREDARLMALRLR